MGEAGNDAGIVIADRPPTALLGATREAREQWFQPFRRLSTQTSYGR